MWKLVMCLLFMEFLLYVNCAFNIVYIYVLLFNLCRDYTSVFTGSKEQPLPGSIEKTDMQQKILESLFSIPDSQKHDPKCMDWKNVVKKVESFGKGLEFCCAGGKQSPPDAKKGILVHYRTLCFNYYASIVWSGGHICKLAL